MLCEDGEAEDSEGKHLFTSLCSQGGGAVLYGSGSQPLYHDLFGDHISDKVTVEWFYA